MVKIKNARQFEALKNPFRHVYQHGVALLDPNRVWQLCLQSGKSVSEPCLDVIKSIFITVKHSGTHLSALAKIILIIVENNEAVSQESVSYHSSSSSSSFSEFRVPAHRMEVRVMMMKMLFLFRLRLTVRCLHNQSTQYLYNLLKIFLMPL